MDQSVTIAFNYGLENLDALNNLSDDLEVVLEKEAVGELDGHEIATDKSHGFLFMYGANAENLFKVARPVLLQASFMKGAKATLRFGDTDNPDAHEITVDL